MSQSTEIANTNSFLTGFTLGLFAGAAGYFLFGTEKGAQLRQQMVVDWENAKDQLVEDGVIPHGKVTLREVVHGLFQQAFSGDETPTPLTPVSRVSRSTSSTAARKGKRFRGV